MSESLPPSSEFDVDWRLPSDPEVLAWQKAARERYTQRRRAFIFAHYDKLTLDELAADVVILCNNVCCRESCLFCDDAFKPDTGWVLGLPDFAGFVCDGCGEDFCAGLSAEALRRNKVDFPWWYPPQRLHFNRHKGLPLPPGAKLVTRPSRFGNYVSRPTEKTPEAHAVAVVPHRAWVFAPEQADFRELVKRELRGCDLACACPEGWPCHADVLIEVANEGEP